MTIIIFAYKYFNISYLEVTLSRNVKILLKTYLNSRYI